jgi:hypothetical protein
VRACGAQACASGLSCTAALLTECPGATALVLDDAAPAVHALMRLGVDVPEGGAGGGGAAATPPPRAPPPPPGFRSSGGSSSSDADDARERRGGGGGAARVRVGALELLRALARGAPRELQKHWSLFLPESRGTHPRPMMPSLATVLLFDPSPRARAAAAGAVQAMLDGAPLGDLVSRRAAPKAAAAGGGGGGSPGRDGGGGGGGGGGEGGTDGGGAARAAAAPVRTRTRAQPPAARSTAGFLPLSERVSSMVAQLHEVLRHALQPVLAASQPAISVVVLGTLATLVGVTPYERMDPALLPSVLPAIREHVGSAGARRVGGGRSVCVCVCWWVSVCVCDCVRMCRCGCFCACACLGDGGV